MKKEPMGNEREQNGWLGTTLRQTPVTTPDACLDAETLAAWADGGLSAQAIAAVELHASSCSRCTAVMAAMERTTPAAAARHVWTPAHIFRWLAPLAAAATAVAIWIAVPDRPITQVAPAPAHDLAVVAPDAPQRGTVEPGTQNQNPAPSTQNLEPPAQALSAPSARLDKPAAQEEAQMRDELRRERAAPQAFGATAAAPEAPTAAAPPPAATAPAEPPPAAAALAPPAAPPAPMLSTDTLAETATAGAAAQRSNFVSKVVVTAESTAPNVLFRWRVIGSAAIERSTDGGKTWTKTIPLPRDSVKGLTIVGIRAMSDLNAIARMSNGSEFYTSNGGMSWIRMQEK
jgi:hypothetical protein